MNNLSSSELDGFIIGTLLGDSSVIQSKQTHNAYFRCSHCKEQKQLIELKQKILNQVYPVTAKIIHDKRGSYQLYTNRLQYFTKIRQNLYPNGIKIISNKILNKLTPLGLAVWYMDDGGLCLQTDPKDRKKIKSRRARIWSLSFTYDEHLLIKQYFKSVWNIDVKIYKIWKIGGLKYYLEFNSHNFLKFREIIKDFIIPCMLYKIDLKYDSRYPTLYKIYNMDNLTEKAEQLIK